MGEAQFVENTWFYVHICWKCGIKYALESDFRQRKNNFNESWYCPNGHSTVFRDSELEKTKKRLKWAEESRDRYREHWQSEEKKVATYKGHHTRLKNRIKNGVCPCCKRSFKNVKRHIKNKHPKYGDK